MDTAQSKRALYEGDDRPRGKVPSCSRKPSMPCSCLASCLLCTWFLLRSTSPEWFSWMPFFLTGSQPFWPHSYEYFLLFSPLFYWYLEVLIYLFLSLFFVLSLFPSSLQVSPAIPLICTWCALRTYPLRFWHCVWLILQTGYRCLRCTIICLWYFVTT